MPSRPRVIIRDLDPSDPRSLDHPSHRDALGELAESLGRALADKFLEEMGGKDETRSTLRSVLKRSAKRPINRRSTARLQKRRDT